MSTPKPAWKSRANPNPPNVDEGHPRKKNVPMAPKINQMTGGQADGAKRIINSEASPSKTTSTFRAPRSSGGSSDPTCCGYTKLKM